MKGKSFIQIIRAKLDLTLTGYGFEIKDQFENYIKYENNGFYISISHNQREETNTLWVGRSERFPIEINDDILKEFFNSKVKIEQISMEEFVNEVFYFFNHYGQNLLMAKEKYYIDLENFFKNKNEKFTSELLTKQYLDAADRAWKKKDYRDVLKNLDLIDNEHLTQSFKQKYKIAKRFNNENN